MESKLLPDWLILWIWEALLGEIYPQIRAIAVQFTKSHELLIRYYLDREPNEEDYESIDVVLTNILANTSSNKEIKVAKSECIFDVAPIGNLNKLDELVYARKE